MEGRAFLCPKQRFSSLKRRSLSQAWAKWEDETQVFMSRMERLTLENTVAAKYAAR